MATEIKVMLEKTNTIKEELNYIKENIKENMIEKDEIVKLSSFKFPYNSLIF